MTAAAQAPEGASRPRALSLVNAILAVVALLLAILFVVVLATGSLFGLRTSDSKQQRLLEAVTGAARDETGAMMTIDYRHMDPLIARVLAGATGTFKQQYQRSSVQLKAAAQAEKVISHGGAREVAVSDITGSHAVAFVAADSMVSNTAAKTPVPRSWRIKMELVNTGGKWLVSNLEFVG